MLPTSIIILSILIGVLSIILMRIYDKFYNKQYVKSDYIKIFILTTISSISVLYLNSIIIPTLPGNKSLSNTQQLGGNNQNKVLNSVGTSVVSNVTNALNDNLDYFNPVNNSHNMRFKTGTPNF